jgi:hypothetical protein
MSARSPTGDLSEYRSPRKLGRLVALRACRYALCLAVVVGLVGAPIGGLAAASASPSRVSPAAHVVPNSHSSGGQWSGQQKRHHQRVVIVTVDGRVTSGGSGSDFTLTADSSTIRSLLHTSVTIAVSSGTTYKQKGVASPVVVPGEFVTVTGALVKGSDATVIAVTVVIDTVKLTGFVASGGSGESFTLTVTTTTVTPLTSTVVTINVNGSTKYKQRGVSSPSVLPGDFVFVTAAQTAGKPATFLGLVVTIPAVQVSGIVASDPPPSSFTLTALASTIYGLGTVVTVNVSSSTVIKEKGWSGKRRPTINVGDNANVTGAQAGTNTVDAFTIIVTPKRHGHGGGPGGNWGGSQGGWGGPGGGSGGSYDPGGGGSGHGHGGHGGRSGHPGG